MRSTIGKNFAIRFAVALVLTLAAASFSHYELSKLTDAERTLTITQTSILSTIN